MKLVVSACAFALALIAGQASAQETTYTFTGGTYDTLINAAPGACVVGECATYTNTMRTVISVTFAAPLAPGLPLADRTADVIRYTASDGVRTTNGPDPIASLDGIEIATDALGNVSDFSVGVQRTPGPPYAINTPADPNSRFSFMIVLPNQSIGQANRIAPARGPRAGSAVSGPGHAIGQTPDAQGSAALSNAPSTVSVTSVANVPTMTEWAMILFGTILAGGAALYIQRRRQFV